MPYRDFLPRPGIVRDPTRFAVEGAWYDCNRVRFRNGLPETIGGWAPLTTGSYEGVARALHDWSASTLVDYIAVGTNTRLYVMNGQTYYDITPIDRISTSVVTIEFFGAIPQEGHVTDPHHGAAVGDYVNLVNVDVTLATGAVIADATGLFRIVDVIDEDTYVIVARGPTSAGFVGDSSFPGQIHAEYYVCSGETDVQQNTAYGAGAYGAGPYGGLYTTSLCAQIRLWSFDNYGDDLIACPRSGPVLYWDESDGFSVRAKKITDITRAVRPLDPDPISTVSGSTTVTVFDILGHDLGVGDEVRIAGASATGGLTTADLNGVKVVTSTPTESTFTFEVTSAAGSTASGGGSSVVATYVAGTYYGPRKALSVAVSEEGRHVIAFGTNPIGSEAIDPLFVRWSDSEDAASWRPDTENLAGGRRLSSGSQIVGHESTRQERVIWTNSTMHSMRYIGEPFVFAITEIAKNVSMLSPNAKVAAGDRIFFADKGGFYEYSGTLNEIPCPVKRYILDDIDYDQAFKVFGASNSDYSEISFFYPSVSGGTGEVDRYVSYNILESLWSFGELDRTSWIEAGTIDEPIATPVNKVALGTDPISMTIGDRTVTVTAVGHGLSVGDVVTFDGLTAVGDLTVNSLRAARTVDTVVDADTFTFELYPFTAVPTSTATGGGSAGYMTHSASIYRHEYGVDADGAAMGDFIESAIFDIGNGDNQWFVDRIIPDIEFVSSSADPDAVRITIKGREYPMEALRSLASADIRKSDLFEDVRARGREITLRFASTGSGYGWRLGRTRLAVREDGRR